MSRDYSTGPDHYAVRARKEGYPARSVYKLDEIQQKFRLIRKGGRLLDVGAAPGSWTLFALKVLKGTGTLVSVDPNPLALGHLPRNVTFLQGDITTGELREEVLARGPFDLIMSDAAPSTTGNRTVDAGRSSQLVTAILDLASGALVTGGNLVVKVFQGGDEREILERARSSFETARFFKPKASRDNSFETYCVGLKKRPNTGGETHGERR